MNTPHHSTSLPNVFGFIAASALVAVVASAEPQPVRYRLLDPSTFTQKYCLDPCDCIPFDVDLPMTGSFLLVFESTNTLFDFYRVDAINWRVVVDEQIKPIAGRGRYSIGGEVALLQEMSLSLNATPVGDVKVDSGTVIVGTAWPDIRIVMRSLQSGCEQTVVTLLATPTCPSDFDGSGFVDTDDFDSYVRAFIEGLDAADFDASGFVDTDDYDAFVGAFELGC